MGHVPPGIRDCAPGIIPTGSRGPARALLVHPPGGLRCRGLSSVFVLGAWSRSAGGLVPSLHTHPWDSRTGDQHQQPLFHIGGAGGVQVSQEQHLLLQPFQNTPRTQQPSGWQSRLGIRVQPAPTKSWIWALCPPPDMLAIVIPWIPLLLLGYKTPTNIPDLAAPLKEHLVCWEEEAPRSRAFVPRDEPLL